MLGLAVLAGIFSLFTSEPTHYHIEERVDELLPAVNRFIQDIHLEEITIPDLGFEAAPVFIGVTLKNLSTIYRKGSAEMWGSAYDSLTIKATIGLRDMQIHVDLCPFMQDSFVWTVGEGTVEVTFTMHPSSDSPCVTTWDYFNITQLDNIVVHTTNPEWDNKPPPEQIMPYIIPYYNKWNNIKELRDAAAKHLNLCDVLYYNIIDNLPS